MHRLATSDVPPGAVAGQIDLLA